LFYYLHLHTPAVAKKLPAKKSRTDLNKLVTALKTQLTDKFRKHFITTETLPKQRGFLFYNSSQQKTTFVSLHKLHFMLKSTTILVFALLLFSCKKNQAEKDIIQTEKQPLEINDIIAYAHGIEHWHRVDEIKFTFNVQRGDSHSERSWIWKPKTDDVTLIQNDERTLFNRNQLDSLSLNADKAFINDKYWLLAPFNLVWDKGITFTQDENSTTPIGSKSAQKLTIVYGDEGGYTPGDAYDFYFGDDFLIKEWIFRRGNDSLPTLTTTWENYENYKGIKISTMRQTEDQSFKLFFTNIEVITGDE